MTCNMVQVALFGQDQLQAVVHLHVDCGRVCAAVQLGNLEICLCLVALAQRIVL
jgi:hypothetical protein